MSKKDIGIIVVVILAMLAAGGWLWCEQSHLDSGRPASVVPPETGEGQNVSKNTDTQAQADWKNLAMEWPVDILDVSRWEKLEIKVEGVELLLPKTWRVNENSIIYPDETDESWIHVYRSPLPEYFKGKIGKEFSVAEAIMSKHLVYDDGYNFTLQGNRFNEVSVPIGTGIEYPRLLETFYEYPSVKDKTRERRLFILFSEKTKETYSFQYEWNFYNPVIDRAFEEMVKSARVLE